MGEVEETYGAGRGRVRKRMVERDRSIIRDKSVRHEVTVIITRLRCDTCKLLPILIEHVTQLWNENRGGRGESSATQKADMNSVEAIDFPILANPPLAYCGVVEGLGLVYPGR